MIFPFAANEDGSPDLNDGESVLYSQDNVRAFIGDEEKGSGKAVVTSA